MESGTVVVMLVAAAILALGVYALPSTVSVWTPAPKPFIERVLLVGGDLVVDVRNPSDKPLECTVYNSGNVLAGPRTIGPGKVATYTGPSSGRDIYVDCVSGAEVGRGFSIAHQVAGLGQGGSGLRVGGGNGGQGNGDQENRLELRHFSCEVRAVGNRHSVRLHVNVQAVANNGAKPYNFTVDFGDGTVETSIQEGSAYTTNHRYAGPGPYVAKLTVTDMLGNRVERQVEVPGGCRNA